MIIRPRQGLLASTAVASVALLSTFPAMVFGAAPVVVTDYKQLVGTIGSNNDYGTGERFTRYTHTHRVHEAEKLGTLGC